jgi:sugar phosphate isomerase/epimerase
MKLGCSTWGMPKVPIDQAVAHIAGLGFQGIEITVAPGWSTELGTLSTEERKRIAGLVKQHGLTLSAIGHAVLLESDALREVNQSWVRSIVDLAAEWAQDGRPPVVNVLSGGRTAEWDTQLDATVERMVEAAHYAQSKGVTLAMEPHVDMLVDTPDRTLEVLKLVNSSALRVNFDISHFDVLGLSLQDSIDKLAPYAVHAHVKDQRGRHPAHQFMIPGEGDFDYVNYLKSMQGAGYSGFITAEISIMRQRKPDYDPIAAATLAYQTLSAAFATAGISR